MASEPLHHRAGQPLPGSAAAVDEPVYLYRRERLEPSEELRNGTVFHRNDELVQIYKGYPPRVKAVSPQTVVVSGELTPVSRKGNILHQSLPDILLQHRPGAVCALVVIDVELVHAPAAVPFNPFLEIRTLVLGYGAHRQIILRLRVVVPQTPFQPYGVKKSEAQYAPPPVPCHLVRNHSGNYLSHHLIHKQVSVKVKRSSQRSKPDFSGSMLSNAARMSAITRS